MHVCATKRAHACLCLVFTCEYTVLKEIFVASLLLSNQLLCQKFLKDPNIGCGDIFKILLMFLDH